MRSFLGDHPDRRWRRVNFSSIRFAVALLIGLPAGREEESERSGKKSGKGSTADRKYGFGSTHFPLSTCHHLLGCAALSIVACTATLLLPRCCLVVLHWHGGHIHQHESRCNLFSNSAAILSLLRPAGDPRLDAAAAAAALERKKWSKKQEPQKEEGRPSAFVRPLSSRWV